MLRTQAISEYRKMKGRPMNNGRNTSLATDPTRLFSSVGGADVRRDAGRGPRLVTAVLRKCRTAAAA